MKKVCIFDNMGHLTIGKIYDVGEFASNNHYFKTSFYSVTNDNGEIWFYDKGNFIDVKEYRRMKLEKLNKI